MKLLFLSLLSALVLSACTTAKTDTEQFTYTCSDGNLYAVYPYQDKNQTDMLDLVLPNGDKEILTNVVAASGAKYVGKTYEWWSKGDTANFSHGDLQLECRLAPAK